MYHRDRDCHGGGVLVLIRSLIPSFRRSEFEMNCEMLWLDLHISGGVVSFVVYYRSPGSSVDSLKLLEMLCCLTHLNIHP